jgi:hypothetical protein
MSPNSRYVSTTSIRVSELVSISIGMLAIEMAGGHDYAHMPRRYPAAGDSQAVLAKLSLADLCTESVLTKTHDHID